MFLAEVVFEKRNQSLSVLVPILAIIFVFTEMVFAWEEVLLVSYMSEQVEVGAEVVKVDAVKGPLPAAQFARTCTLYEVPAVSPVMLYEVVATSTLVNVVDDVGLY